MTPEAAIAAAIKAAREQSRMTQTQLARRTGLKHQQIIDRIEQGARPVRFIEAVNISRALGLDMGHLLSLVPELPEACGTCYGSPARGFTCNECGVSS